MTKKITLSLTLISFIFAIFALVGVNTMQHSAAVSSKITYGHPLYPANFNDNSALMGASHNVFVGKVVSQVDTGELAGNPTTKFSVKILKSIKGELNEEAMVTQLAGYRDGVLYIIDEDNKLLEVGSTYIFATRYNPEDDTYTLNTHANASKLLSSDSSKNLAALAALADQDEKVRAF